MAGVAQPSLEHFLDGNMYAAYTAFLLQRRIVRSSFEEPCAVGKNVADFFMAKLDVDHNSATTRQPGSQDCVCWHSWQGDQQLNVEFLFLKTAQQAGHSQIYCPAVEDHICGRKKKCQCCGGTRGVELKGLVRLLETNLRCRQPGRQDVLDSWQAGAAPLDLRLPRSVKTVNTRSTH
ncbi:hypothetical protein WJX79_006422 [Trebouxia sp. C0005]